MRLGISFLKILVDFGTQVGTENPPKIYPKRDRKNDVKKKSSKMAIGGFPGRLGCAPRCQSPPGEE